MTLTLYPSYPVSAHSPPLGEIPSKPFILRRYKAAATTLLKANRVNECKKHNQVNLACSLSPEILQSIFTTCAWLSIDLPTWSWVEVANVCAVWRQAALACRDLWSLIDFSSPKWTFLTLYRSQMLPIFVTATVVESNCNSVKRTLRYAPRIRAIHLKASPQDITPLLWTLQSPNQHLESLVIDITPSDEHCIVCYPKWQPRGEHSPLLSLRHLELYHAPFDLISPRYIGLTSLSLHHLPPSECPAHSDFFALLERFVVLQHLKLEHAFPRTASDGTKHPAVHLRHLRSVSLIGSIVEITAALDGIGFPFACKIHCHVDCVDGSETKFRRLAGVIGAHFDEMAADVTLHSLVFSGRETSLRFTEDYTLNLDFRQSLRVRAFGSVEHEDSDPLLDLVLGPDPDTCRDEMLVSAVMSLWETLPLGNIDTLALRGLDIITHRIWQQLLPAVPSVRVLDVGGHAPSGLIWALLLNARSHSHLEHDDKTTLLLPHLNDIYLREIDCFAGGLMQSSSGLVNSHCNLDDSKFLDVLLAYLEDRQRCNLEPRCLSLSRCQNVSKEVLNQLKSVVAYLAWDGRGMYKPVPSAIGLPCPATYRLYWPGQAPPLRHYFRLQRLLDLDNAD